MNSAVASAAVDSAEVLRRQRQYQTVPSLAPLRTLSIPLMVRQAGVRDQGGRRGAVHRFSGDISGGICLGGQVRTPPTFFMYELWTPVASNSPVQRPVLGGNTTVDYTGAGEVPSKRW